MNTVLLFALRSVAFIWSTVVLVLVILAAVALPAASMMPEDRVYDAVLLLGSAAITAPVLWFGTQERYVKRVRPAELPLLLICVLPVAGLVLLMLAIVLVNVVAA